MKKLLSTFLLTSLLFFPFQTQAQTDADKYPRMANYFLLSGSHLQNESTKVTLSTFDLLVLPAEAQVYNKTFFSEIRAMNPDIVILAYVPTVSYNNLYWNDSLHKKLKAGIQSSWWLKNSSGSTLNIWPGTSALNLNSGWAEYLASYAASDIYSTGYWDGIFFDEVNDWPPSGSSVSSSEWQNGYVNLFSKTRSRLGSQAVIISNGSSNSLYHSYVNGRMFESFPTPWEASGDWDSVMEKYLDLENQVAYEPIFVINANTDNTGDQTDYQSVRYGITSTLLGGGYFGFDYGTQSHAQTWTYDEYGAYLGSPKGDPEDLLNSENQEITESVWARDFENGKVVVNSSGTSQTIRLDGEYEKLHGTQDSYTNNGTIVSRLTIASEDGIILLRPIEQINGATFQNGSFAKIYDLNGASKRTGFFVYDPDYQGGQNIIRYNIDEDEALETVIANKTEVIIYDDNGEQQAAFCPYTENYDLGINISIGDLEGDGSVEIITGTEYGAGPQLRIFNKDGNLIHPGFFAYDEAFRGGVHVALGDVNNDGQLEVIAGAGRSGGPHIRVFNKDGILINPGFFAYDEAFRGGVYVATGDVDGDGQIEIVAGAGPGGGPHVRVFDQNGNLENEFFIGSTTETNGAKIIVADVDGDGIDEIVGLSEDVFTMSNF